MCFGHVHAFPFLAMYVYISGRHIAGPSISDDYQRDNQSATAVVGQPFDRLMVVQKGFF